MLNELAEGGAERTTCAVDTIMARRYINQRIRRYNGINESLSDARVGINDAVRSKPARLFPTPKTDRMNFLASHQHPGGPPIRVFS